MPRYAAPVSLAETDRLELERWVAAHNTPQQVSQRCQIVLAASQGQPDKDIAMDLEINFNTAALSRDPNFLQKLTDVVGLYLNPPEKALVLCVDEKSQIQALDRTQPGLPLKKGRCGTMTHDYKRNGTTTLFAALEVAKERSSANA